jgi:hypothetical protein
MIHLDILRREVREEDAALARHASRTAVYIAWMSPLAAPFARGPAVARRPDRR